MRYIDIKKIRLPEGWLEEAAQALDDVRNLPPAERLKGINRHASVWRELKTALAEISHQKCWYCESKEIRSDNPIDHFRPKGSVIECSDHEGYWWLAFEYTNYRFCCTYCNSHREDEMAGTVGGKAGHFSLQDESKRAVKEGDDIKAESPCLLDPTKASDPGLLFFNQDGNAIPRYSKEAHSYLYCRAKKSIKDYHLNHYMIVTQRKILYNDIDDFIKDGDVYFNRYSNGDQLAEHALCQVIDRLSRFADEKSPFSAAARYYIMGLRACDREWLEGVFVTY